MSFASRSTRRSIPCVGRICVIVMVAMVSMAMMLTSHRPIPIPSALLSMAMLVTAAATTTPSEERRSRTLERSLETELMGASHTCLRLHHSFWLRRKLQEGPICPPLQGSHGREGERNLRRLLLMLTSARSHGARMLGA